MLKNGEFNKPKININEHNEEIGYILILPISVKLIPFLISNFGKKKMCMYYTNKII
jgi:hypothetical protein